MQTKELKTERLTFRMTAEEAKRLEAAAKLLDKKPAYLARLAISAISQSALEKYELEAAM